MEFDFFVGTDVSKNELDFAVMRGETLLFHKEISNEPSAINGFLKELTKLSGFDLGRTVFCMEHTGIYNNHLLVCLHKRKANICLQAATHIKNSLGNIRGKNDKIDAIRIADYAYTQQRKLRLWQPKREVIQELSHLAAVRSRLIAAKKLLKVSLGEHNLFSSKKIARQNTTACTSSLKAIDNDIESVEKTMGRLISTDGELKRLFELVSSVKGIGKVTATQILISTNEFKDFNNPKKFACYSGVVPFTDDSGKVKKKARVSHMANKKVKTLLHLSAIVAIRHNPDLKLYYQRMITQEKKNKMSVINAVRNKLVLRVFACVNQNRKYENIYPNLVA